MKYKVGDKVKIVSLQSEGRGCCMDVVGDIGEIVLYNPANILWYKVKIEDGGSWWWEESNLELIEDTKPNTSEVIETTKGETEMDVTKVETTTPKFKKGDIVIRTEFSYQDGRMIRGNHYVVHSCVGSYVYLEGVYDKEGELYCFSVNNFDLVKAYEDKPSTKFKKGDKVKVVGETSAMNVELGGIYTIVNPCHHTGYVWGKKSNYVSLEEVQHGTPNEDCLELYIEPRNYRHMKPTDLIKVSIDGFEDEIPLGDLIHTQALIGNSRARFGVKLYCLLKAIDENGICRDAYSTIEVYGQQEKLMKDFFVIDAQKEADKANLKKLISNKQNELKELQDKLNQLEN